MHQVEIPLAGITHTHRTYIYTKVYIKYERHGFSSTVPKRHAYTSNLIAGYDLGYTYVQSNVDNQVDPSHVMSYSTSILQ